jgi:branched-chain amino acid transport system permease protein
VSAIEETQHSDPLVANLASAAAGNLRKILGPKPVVYRRRQREFWVLGAVVLLALPLATTGIYGLGVGRNAMLYSMLAVGFYFQFALSGQFSLATGAFYAAGAYVSAWAAPHGGFASGFVLAVIITGLLGAAVKLTLARSPLIQFGIATLSFGELAFLVFRNWNQFTHGNLGRFGLPYPRLFGYTINTPVRIYLFCAIFVLIGVFLVIMFERSPAQRDQIFTRDMAAVAKTTGLRTGYLQIVAFAIGAAFMGGAGSIFAHTGSFVHPSAFSTEISLDVLLMVLIGGISSPWGPVVGAIVLTLLPEWLRSIATYKDLIYAGGILVVILLLPGGLVSLPRVIQGRLAPLFKKRRAA